MLFQIKQLFMDLKKKNPTTYITALFIKKKKKKYDILYNNQHLYKKKLKVVSNL